MAAVTIFARRASAILYNLLRTRRDPRPFLMPANVCPIVPDTFREARQPMEFVDIAEPSLEIDARECIARLRARPGAYAGLLFVHPYGSEHDPELLFRKARELANDLLIIDDRCLCRPSFEMRPTTADVTLFSTGRAKYADVGGGGFAHLADRIEYEPHAGPDWLDLAPFDDGRYREHVEAATRAMDEHKARLNAIYESALPREICLAPELQRWRFSIRVPRSANLIDAIFAAGLFASRHFPAVESSFPVAEKLHAEIVNLFNDRYFDEESARRVTQVVLRHLGA